MGQPRALPPVIDVALIGDSHANILRQYLAPRLRFAASMVAPSKHFAGQFCTIADDRLHIAQGDLLSIFPRLDGPRRDAMLNARARLDTQLQAIIAARGPIVSTLGSATHRFYRTHAAGFRTQDQAAPQYSGKMLRALLGSFCAPYLDFHRHLVTSGRTVVFVPAPARIPDEHPAPWLAYDGYMHAEMTRMGVTVLDTHGDTCDETGTLRADFAADDVLHGNDTWNALVINKLAQVLPEMAIGQDRS